jgi:hypothetical protein
VNFIQLAQIVKWRSFGYTVMNLGL